MILLIEKVKGLKQTMENIYVLLDSIEKIRRFVDIIEKSEADADLSQGNRHVDAKSLFGALSLVSSSPARLKIYGDEDIVSALIKEIGQFIVINK